MTVRYYKRATGQAAGARPQNKVVYREEEEEGDFIFYFLLFLPSVGFLPVDEMGRKRKEGGAAAASQQ